MMLDEEMGRYVPQEKLRAEVLNFVNEYFNKMVIVDGDGRIVDG